MREIMVICPEASREYPSSSDFTTSGKNLFLSDKAVSYATSSFILGSLTYRT